MSTALATPWIAIALIAGTPLAQVLPQHARAEINDSRSHGQVGDNFLSLNEAIELNNGTITIAQLSAAEYAQINGFGDVAYASIDWFRTPLVTLERDLDIILETSHGLTIGNTGGKLPTIDFKNFQGFRAYGGFLGFKSLHLKGGNVGVTIIQDDAVYGASVDACVFDGQVTCGVHVIFATDATPTASKNSRLDFSRNVYTGLPQAVLVEDLGKDRTGQVTIFDERVQNCGLGFGIVLNGQGGDMVFDFDHMVVESTPSAFNIVRTVATATRKVKLENRHMVLSNVNDGFRYIGSATATSELLFLACDLSASTVALDIGPATANCKLTMRDSRLAGPISITAGGSASQVTLENVRAKNGAWSIGSTGGSLLVKDTILDAIQIQTSGTAPLQLDDVRFVGGSVAGTAAAPVLVSNSFIGTAQLGTNTSTSGSLPAAQLGSCDITPLAPTIGQPLSLNADLPQGLVGFWILGRVSFSPITLPEFRVYFDLFEYFSIPTPVRLQQKLVIPIPPDPGLITYDGFAQLAIVHDPGVLAPTLNLAPGRRFMIQ